jgi:hypothetical protein
MEGVQIGEEPGGAFDELVARPAQEVAFAGQPGEELLGLVFEPLDQSEDSVALGHVDGAEFASPVVDRREEMPVDGAEVGEVVAPEVEAFGEKHELGCGGKAGLGSGEESGR